jgi:hypothetical protein
MSRAFDAAMKRTRAVEVGEEPIAEASEQETYNPEKSLRRKIMESTLYDGKPTARFLLGELALLAMNEKSKYPADAPKEFRNDKVGWCWMAQWKLSLRLGTDSDGRTVRFWLAQFVKDGVVIPREWTDEYGVAHSEYKVVEEVIDAFQRPAGKEAQLSARPKRYREGSRTANKGSFSKSNQPGVSAHRRAVLEMDDE